MSESFSQRAMACSRPLLHTCVHSTAAHNCSVDALPGGWELCCEWQMKLPKMLTMAKQLPLPRASACGDSNWIIMLAGKEVERRSCAHLPHAIFLEDGHLLQLPIWGEYCGQRINQHWVLLLLNLRTNTKYA